MTRWRGHVYAAKKSKPWAFQHAIRKYGIDAFDHEILEICYSPKEGLEREKHWIETFKSATTEHGYNLTLGGDGGVRSIEGALRFKEAMNRPEVRANNSRIQKIVSNMPEAKAKRSVISIRVMQDPQMKALISEQTKKAMARPEVVEKMAAYNSDEKTKLKRSDCVKKSWNDPLTRKKRLAALDSILIRHAITQYAMDGTEISQYKSVSEAARQTGTHKASLLAHLHGKNKTAGGFLWKRTIAP